MKKWLLMIAVAALLSAVGFAYVRGDLQLPRDHNATAEAEEEDAASPKADVSALPVTVAVVKPAAFVETVMVTGSLVPREEILVAAEIEGQRIVSLSAEEGDYVNEGDLLATLESSTLRAQQAQNLAAIARADAAIAQAKSLIAESEARLYEAEASLKRAEPLRKDGHVSQAVFDQREALARTARAQAMSAKNGLALAEAEKKQAEARGRELEWQLSKTDVRAPHSGLISRRTARIGALVSSTRDPLFVLIANAEIELDAEVPEAKISRLKIGQTARITVSGGETVTGTVRLISPEVNKASRLGHVRVFLGRNPNLRVGAFARGTIETSRSNGLAVPQSAVLYRATDAGQRALVQRIRNDRIETVEVTIGAIASGLAEITSGLEEGDIVVAKSGTFLRDGDIVRPVMPAPKVSEAGQ